MLELGDSSAEIHRKTGELAVSEKPYAVFFIGQEMVHAYNAANAYCKAHCMETKVFSEPHTDDAAVQKVTEKILELVSEGDLVLVKGSRGLRLERIASVLCEKAGVVV
jgi:UDP-N-acetylmuramoyl-tripeptide--D-alanyl-D-alanine ligase